MFRKLLILILGLALMLLVTACNKTPTMETPAEDVDPYYELFGDSTSPSTEPEEEVDFDLQIPEDPDFEDTINYLTDLEPLSQQAPVYETVDDVTYEIDPETKERIGIVEDGVTVPITEDIVEVSNEPEIIIEPTEETKYPNTGIFLGDD